MDKLDAAYGAQDSESLACVKRTFPLIQKIDSSMSKKDITSIAADAGMIIPSTNPFNYFINNIRHYENVLIQSAPTVAKLVRAPDASSCAMTYSDSQLLELCPLDTWSSRPQLVDHVIKTLVSPIGFFSLPCSDASVYDSSCKVIVYSVGEKTYRYSSSQLIKAVSRDTFPPEAVRQLSSLAKEKSIRWRRDNLVVPEIINAFATL